MNDDQRILGPAAVAAAAMPDPWADLRAHTPARIALGRAGASLPTAELLRFNAALAQARDAVHTALDVAALQTALQTEGWPSALVLASRATDRASYLRRPDLGRRLDEASAERLRAAAADFTGPADLALVLGDGLSALALQRHALPLLVALRDALSAAYATDAGGTATATALRWAPLTIATQTRVALADEVGAAWPARLVLVLLGERPGLSAPDSLGAYLTHAPAIGCHDAMRNCVSNIRPEGLAPAQAAMRLAWLIRHALRRRLTGVGLKDDSGTVSLTR